MDYLQRGAYSSVLSIQTVIDRVVSVKANLTELLFPFCYDGCYSFRENVRWTESKCLRLLGISVKYTSQVWAQCTGQLVNSSRNISILCYIRVINISTDAQKRCMTQISYWILKFDTTWIDIWLGYRWSFAIFVCACVQWSMTTYTSLRSLCPVTSLHWLYMVNQFRLGNNNDNSNNIR